MKEKVSRMGYYYPCHKCNYRSLVRTNILRHMAAKHNALNKKTFKCKFCSGTFQKADEFKSHLRKCEEKKQVAINGKSKKVTYLYEVIPNQEEETGVIKSVVVNKITNVTPLMSRKKSKKVKIINCFHCSYKSKESSNIRRHMKMKHKVATPKINRCEVCGEYFENSFVLRKHIKSNCGNDGKSQKAEPSRTALNFKLKADLSESEKPMGTKNIRKNNTNILEKFKCTECSYSSARCGDVRSHMKKVHRIVNPKFMKCNFCSTLFGNKFFLRSHHKSGCQDAMNGANRKPKEEEPEMPLLFPVDNNNSNGVQYPMFYCSKCHKVCKSDEDLELHTEQDHNVDISSQPPDIEDYGDDKLLLDAKKIKVDSSNYVKLYSCLNCNYKSKYTNHIRCHMTAVHGVINPKICKCQFCQVYFRNERALKSHVRTCTRKTEGQYPPKKGPICRVPKKLHHCQYCNKNFKTIIHLRMHKKKVHFNNNPNNKNKIEAFNCLICDYQSAYTCSVRLHMKVVHKISNPKIHQCNFCGEMFKDLFILKRHRGEDFCANTNKDFAEQINEFENRKWYYYCPKCSYRANYPRGLKNHAKIRHKIKLHKFFKCESCRQGFGRRAQLKNHTCIPNSVSKKNNKKKRVYRREVPAIEKIFVCQLCDEVFVDKVIFDAHRRVITCSDTMQNINGGKVLYGKPLLFPKIIIERCSPQKIASKGASIGQTKGECGGETVKMSNHPIQNEKNSPIVKSNTDVSAKYLNILKIKPSCSKDRPKNLQALQPVDLISSSDEEILCDELVSNECSIQDKNKPPDLHFSLTGLNSEKCSQNNPGLSEPVLADARECSEEVSVSPMILDSEVSNPDADDTSQFAEYAPEEIIYIAEECEPRNDDNNVIDIFACYDNIEDEFPVYIVDDNIDVNFGNASSNDRELNESVIIKEEFYLPDRQTEETITGI